MPRRSIATASIYFAREFSGKVAMSLAASAVAASVLALPGVISPGRSVAALAEAGDRPAIWTASIAADGKIGERHRDAAGTIATADRSGPGLLVPAVVAMPMRADWPQVEFGEAWPVRLAVAAADERATANPPQPAHKADIALVRSKAVAQVLLPPTRPLIVAADRSGAAPPVMAVAAQTAALDQPSASPMARVGDAMSSAVGSVGAAGIWTLSRASALLPRL